MSAVGILMPTSLVFVESCEIANKALNNYTSLKNYSIFTKQTRQTFSRCKQELEGDGDLLAEMGIKSGLVLINNLNSLLKPSLLAIDSANYYMNSMQKLKSIVKLTISSV